MHNRSNLCMACAGISLPDESEDESVDITPNINVAAAENFLGSLPGAISNAVSSVLHLSSNSTNSGPSLSSSAVAHVEPITNAADTASASVGS